MPRDGVCQGNMSRAPTTSVARSHRRISSRAIFKAHTGLWVESRLQAMGVVAEVQLGGCW